MYIIGVAASSITLTPYCFLFFSAIYITKEIIDITPEQSVTIALIISIMAINVMRIPPLGPCLTLF